jgi:hypothetical protein
MRITIIAADRTVYIDGRAVRLAAVELPEIVAVVQYDTERNFGWFEFQEIDEDGPEGPLPPIKPPNLTIGEAEFAPLRPLVDEAQAVLAAQPETDADGNPVDLDELKAALADGLRDAARLRHRLGLSRILKSSGAPNVELERRDQAMAILQGAQDPDPALYPLIAVLVPGEAPDMMAAAQWFMDRFETLSDDDAKVDGTFFVGLSAIENAATREAAIAAARGITWPPIP